MKINQEWLQKQYDGTGENAPDEYVLAILKVGEKVLLLCVSHHFPPFTISGKISTPASFFFSMSIEKISDNLL